jgi:hypothetical protein
MARTRAQAPDATRSVGEVFLVPLRRGWWGAGRLIEVEVSRVRPIVPMYTFLVLDGFWRSPPDAPKLLPLAPMTGPYSDEDEWKAWFKGPWPSDFVVVGRRTLTRAERALAVDSGTMVFQSAKDFADELFQQWRWLNEREALEAEESRARARREVKQREEARAGRKGLSLARMARERPFHDWSEHWPRSVVVEARRIFRQATRDLMALERDAGREERASVLRRIVDEFNALDARRGCIETGEREQIIDRIEELASLVGLKNTREALTGHRDW